MKKSILYSLVAIHFLLILFFWWNNSGIVIGTSTANTYLSIGRLFGLVGASLILFQFVLIGRTRFIEEVFGLDRLAKLHRINGKIALCVILLHPVLLLLGYSLSSGVSLLEQEITFLTSFHDVLQAAIGLSILCLTVFLSITIVRRKLQYELWYGIHLANYLAIYLAFSHQWQIGEDFLANRLFTLYWLLLYGAVFIAFLLFRIFHQIYLFGRYKFYVEDVKKENDLVTSISIGGKNVQSLQRKSGQFFLYRFLDKKMWWEEHPFSLSNNANNTTLRISAKGVGDFTTRLQKIKKGTRVLVDGPFGIFTTEKASRKKFLLIAGGIGITPIRSMLEELSIKKLDTTLLYSCSTKEEIVLQKELDLLASPKTRVVYILTQDPKFNGEKGRLDTEKLLRLVPDIKEREIYLCGPSPMMKATIENLLTLGVDKKFIHYEHFAL